MRLASLLIMSGCIAACSDARPTTSAAPVTPLGVQDRLSIEETFERWLDAYERGDPDALASLFTADAIYAANTGELLQGRKDIRAGAAAWMQGSSRVGQQRAHAMLDVQRRQLRFRREGAIAYDLARFTITIFPRDCVVDSGHALTVLEKQPDGSWLIDALTVNQDKTPPPNACNRA